MISFTQGNLLEANTKALVNTVNTVGVMGKGIALQFKEAFPENNKIYVKACKDKKLVTGKLLLHSEYNAELGYKLIINFPTKEDWRKNSEYSYIESGLKELRKVIQINQIESIAIPSLGCGNGGLNWNKVKQLIIDILGDLDCQIIVYEPAQANAYFKSYKENKKPAQLTPARACLLYALFAFESIGEYSSLFVANKLAYFLQRKGQNLRLQFKAHHYGPYALGVQKVLYALNGTYLKGLEQGSIPAFEPLQLNYEKWEEINEYVHHKLPAKDLERLNSLLIFIAQFTSELSLEILASVDFILQENPSFTFEQVMDKIRDWNQRKKELFKPELVKSIYEYLEQNKIQVIN